MLFEDLIETLYAVGIEPTAREVAEAIWLAQHVDGSDAVGTSDTTRRRLDGTDHDEVSQRSHAPKSTDRVQVGVAADSSSTKTLTGYPIQLPGAPGLPRSHDVQKALRPLRRRVRSRHQQTLDEDATAAFIASTGIWSAVQRPAPRRWFDAAVIVDTSASMDLWQPLVSDLLNTLVRTGAFRDVRQWGLQAGAPHCTITSVPSRAQRHPAELIDGAGQRLFLVVTDGAARMWHDGTAGQVLALWGRTAPVAVLQTLPEMLWGRTGLRTHAGRLKTAAPGLPNINLSIEYRHSRPGRPATIGIPVVGIEPVALRQWARLVAGVMSDVPLAVHRASLDAPGPSPAPPSVLPAEAYDQFAATASPPAYTLAVCLTAAPLTLPVMRLVQHAIDPDGNLSSLAEVLLGGLLTRTGTDQYHWLPGVHERLSNELRRSEFTKVIAAVSEHFATRTGSRRHAFDAVAATSDGPVAGATPLAWVQPEIAARFGIPVAALSHTTLQDVGEDTTSDPDTVPAQPDVSRFVGDADDHLRRIVDAILGIPGVTRRSVRDAYLEALAGLVGETPRVNRSNDSERDVAAMVAWCAEQPGGLFRLVDAVATVEEGSAAVDRLRALTAVREPVEVLRSDERVMIERLLSDLDEPSRAGLLGDIAIRWGPRFGSALRDPGRVINLLEDSIAGFDEPHPLSVFLDRLARRLDNEEVGMLADAVGDRTGHRPEARAAAPQLLNRHYFVVRLSEDGRDGSRYLLTAWLASEDGRWETRCTSEVAKSLEDIKSDVDDELYRLAQDAVADDITDLWVEFIVPRSLLHADFDQWIVSGPGHSSPLGVHYPVVVRDLPRMRNRIIRGRWTRRCTWMHQNGETAGGTNVDDADPRPQSIFGELMKDPETPACLVVMRPASYVTSNISAWLSAGIPVIVWCRNENLAARFDEYVRKPLERNGIANLLNMVWRLRQDADRSDAPADHVGRHITVLWDCAHRLPPDERPLRQGAVSVR